MSLTTEPATAAPPLTLGRVVVLVREYEAALAFYRAAFGAHVLFDARGPSGDRYLHLGFGATAEQAGSSTAVTGAGVWLMQPGEADDALVGRQTGGQPLAVFYTPDVHAATGRIEAAGGSVVHPVRTADGASFAHVTDLYGNEFVLVELAGDAS